MLLRGSHRVKKSQPILDPKRLGVNHAQSQLTWALERQHNTGYLTVNPLLLLRIP